MVYQRPPTVELPCTGRSLRSRWRLCRLTDAACPLRAVSAMYGDIQPQEGTGAPRHSPDVSLRGAKRRGNLGKALPIYTECRRTQSPPNLTAAALVAQGRRARENVAALTAQPLAALPPYGCGVPLAGCERLRQLQISGYSADRTDFQICHCEAPKGPWQSRSIRSDNRRAIGEIVTAFPRLHPKGTSSRFALRAPRRFAPRNDKSEVRTVFTMARSERQCLPEIAPQGHFLALRAQGATSAVGLLAMTNLGALHVRHECLHLCSCQRRSLTAATDAIGACRFNGSRYETTVRHRASRTPLPYNAPMIQAARGYPGRPVSIIGNLPCALPSPACAPPSCGRSARRPG